MKKFLFVLWTFVQVCLSGEMSGSPRPYLHSKLARAMYDKMLNDETLKNVDYLKFYAIDTEKLSAESAEKFIQFQVDEETREFLDNCFEQADSVLLQLWHSLAKSVLSLVMSQTSVNGLLNRGRMFVWSRRQAQILLDDPKEDYGSHRNIIQLDHPDQLPTKGASSPSSSASLAVSYCGGNGENCQIISDAAEQPQHPCPDVPDVAPAGDALWWTDKLVLDLGAGDGHVTRIIGEFAKTVYATESSSFMRLRLQQKGCKILNVETWVNEGADLYDLITCLNLLDRCDKPIELLGEIHRKLAPDGKLVVALVLPLNPYVESNSNHHPSERFDIDGTMEIEGQINSFITDVFPSLGFTVLKWTKLPYFCEGDMGQSYYWLSDSVFILKKMP